MKAIDLLAKQSAQTFPTRAAYERWVKKALRNAGEKPVQAKFDAGGNCLYCGEAGRCPGWHTEDEVDAYEARAAAEEAGTAPRPEPQVTITIPVRIARRIVWYFREDDLRWLQTHIHDELGKATEARIRATGKEIGDRPC